MADYPKKIDFEPWIIDTHDIETAATVLAKFAVLLDPHIDQDEAQDILLEWLDTANLDVINVVDVVALLRCTIYNSKFDTMH